MRTNNISRNRPAEKGRKNDPDLRGESAAQPGVQTTSSSKTDEANENVSETAADNFRENAPDKGADADLDHTAADKDGGA